MATPETENQMNAFAKKFRNIFLASGLFVFPALLALLYSFVDYPENRALPILGMPVLGSIVSLVGAAFMHLRRHKLVLDHHQVAAAEQQGDERRSGITNTEILAAVTMVVSPIICGALFLVDVRQSSIAENMADPSSTFAMSAAEPAEVMVKAMHKPVRRAVFVPATGEEGYRKSIVCAEANNGALEIYGFGSTSFGKTFSQIEMNAELEEVAPAFCDAAFARVN